MHGDDSIKAKRREMAVYRLPVKMAAKADMAPHTTASKLQLKYRQPSLRTVRNGVKWKSDN